jgi:dTDP-4-dehydrorhamnose reductase
MKVSVLGFGLLGSELARALAAAGHEVEVFRRPAFDLLREEGLAAACEGADVVVNCAAYTAVDKAEAEPELCRAANALAPGLLGRRAAKAGAFAIHIGSDYVFDGSGERPWREDDPAAPLNVYGASKLEGERLLFESGCRCAVLRVQWTYGSGGANFFSRLLELAKMRPALKVVDDQFGSPTAASDMVQAIAKLAEARLEGLFHYAARGYCSRYESAKLLFGALGLRTELAPCASSVFPAPAKRPLNCRLDCSKIEAALGLRRPSWEESLRAYAVKPSP